VIQEGVCVCVCVCVDGGGREGRSVLGRRSFLSVRLFIFYNTQGSCTVLENLEKLLEYVNVFISRPGKK